MTNRIKRPYLHKRENSWYLRTGVMHNFLCRCGQVDQFWNTVSNIHHPDHRCSSCSNNHYLDSVMFLTEKKVIRWSTFNWYIETIKTEDSWIVRAYASIPLFDHTIQKIRFRKTVIATNTLFFMGKNEYHEDFPMILQKYVYNHLDKATLIKDLIAKELEEELCNFLLADPIEVTEWIEEENLLKLTLQKRIELFSFFLKYPHLKEYDFFYWDNFAIFWELSKEYSSVHEMLDFIFNHRREKSIKKAYFESYANSMMVHGRYNHMADYIFSRYITNRNFLLELIRMDSKVKHVLFNETHMVVVEHMMEFLKEHYIQRTITKLFTNIDSYTHTIRDTVWMYRGEGAVQIEEHFRKVPLNFQSLHNEFIRIHSMYNTSLNGKVVFEYHQNDLNAQSKDESFKYCLPETTHILSQWGQHLHNCMSSYSKSIHKGTTLIFGVFKKEVLTYAIEIRGDKIVQAFGKYNHHIEKEDREEIDKWFKEVYIDTWIRSHRENSSS